MNINGTTDDYLTATIDQYCCYFIAGLYLFFNIYLFFIPAYERFFVHSNYPHSSALRSERVFVPYKDCVFNDPWGAGFDSKILSKIEQQND